MNTTRVERGQRLKGILVVGLTAVRVAVAGLGGEAVASREAKVEAVMVTAGAEAGVVVAVEDGETVATAEIDIEGIDTNLGMTIPSIGDKDIATIMMIMNVEDIGGIAVGRRMIGGAGTRDNRWRMKPLSLIVL